MSYTDVAAGDPIYASTINDLIRGTLNRPWTRLALQANQSIPNTTATAVLFGAGSEIRDDRNWHSTSTNTDRITPDLPGRYQVIGNVYFAANATGDRRIYAAKNGATSNNWSREIANGSNGINSIVGGIYECNGTTDYLSLQVFQSAGAALNIQGTGDTTFSTTFEVVYLGGLI